jgi:hypothetical protein
MKLQHIVDEFDATSGVHSTFVTVILKPKSFQPKVQRRVTRDHVDVQICFHSKQLNQVAISYLGFTQEI